MTSTSGVFAFSRNPIYTALGFTAVALDHNPKEVLTLEETAKWLGVKPETVRRQAKAGFLPGRKIGRAWRFSRAALLEWLKSEDPLDADDLEAIREGLEAIRRGDVVPLDS